MPNLIQLRPTVYDCKSYMKSDVVSSSVPGTRGLCPARKIHAARYGRILEEAKTLLYGSKDEMNYNNVLPSMIDGTVMHQIRKLIQTRRGTQIVELLLLSCRKDEIVL